MKGRRVLTAIGTVLAQQHSLQHSSKSQLPAMVGVLLLVTGAELAAAAAAVVAMAMAMAMVAVMMVAAMLVVVEVASTHFRRNR